MGLCYSRTHRAACCGAACVHGTPAFSPGLPFPICPTFPIWGRSFRALVVFIPPSPAVAILLVNFLLTRHTARYPRSLCEALAAKVAPFLSNSGLVVPFLDWEARLLPPHLSWSVPESRVDIHCLLVYSASDSFGSLHQAWTRILSADFLASSVPTFQVLPSPTWTLIPSSQISGSALV